MFNFDDFFENQILQDPNQPEYAKQRVRILQHPQKKMVHLMVSGILVGLITGCKETGFYWCYRNGELTDTIYDTYKEAEGGLLDYHDLFCDLVVERRM